MRTETKGRVNVSRLLRPAAWTLVMVGAACSTPAATPGRLSPLSARMSDEVIARDLAVFDSLDARLETIGTPSASTSRYVATRAHEYLALAREAYERNDPSGFAEDALGWARADVETLERGGDVAAGAIPATARGDANAELWTRADALRQNVGVFASAADVAMAEAKLVRASHPFLAGPACVDEPALGAATRLLDDADKANAAALAAAAAARDAAAKAAADSINAAAAAAAAAPRRNCTAPETLMGVPTIVHFALDKSFLAPATKEVLDTLVARLKPFPGVTVTVGGHTDPRHTNAYNQALSERRTASVVSYLLARGLPREQIRARSFGETLLRVPGTSVTDHARNRRVEISYSLCDGTEIVPVEQLNDLQLESARRQRAYKEK